MNRLWNKSKLSLTRDYFQTSKYKNTYFYIFCIYLFGVFFLLFYFQGAYFEKYNSDVDEHIEFAHTLFSNPKISYPLFHILVLLIDKIPLISPHCGAALILSLSCIAYILLIRWAFRKHRIETTNLYAIDLLSISLIFVFSIYFPVYNKYMYNFVGGMNVWHNPTYTVLRPFAFLSVFAFFAAYDRYKKGEKYGIRLLLYMGVTILSILAKPSFAFVFLPALAIFLLIEFGTEKFKAFRFCALTAISVIPMMALMYFQYKIMFVPQQTGLVFNFGGDWANSLFGIIVDIMLVNGFSIFALAFGGYKYLFSDKKYLLTFLTLLVSAMQFYLISETGSRAGKGNFSWGFYIGALLFYTVSVYIFINKIKPKPVIRNIGFGIIALQLFTGVYFFIAMLGAMDIRYIPFKYLFT